MRLTEASPALLYLLVIQTTCHSPEVAPSYLLLVKSSGLSTFLSDC